MKDILQHILDNIKVVDRGYETPCWEWQKCKSDDGYGNIFYNGSSRNVHRLLWILKYGDPGKLHVLHKCDNRVCVCPDHLFLGTNLDNVRDRQRKGRKIPSFIGERNPKAKLTVEEVLSLRKLYKKGIPQYQLVQEFGISKAQVSSIVRNKCWNITEGKFKWLRVRQ